MSKRKSVSNNKGTKILKNEHGNYYIKKNDMNISFCTYLITKVCLNNHLFSK